MKTFQITKFGSKKKVINSEYGSMTYPEWLQREATGLNSLGESATIKASGDRVALFITKN